MNVHDYVILMNMNNSDLITTFLENKARIKVNCLWPLLQSYLFVGLLVRHMRVITNRYILMNTFLQISFVNDNYIYNFDKCIIYVVLSSC